MNGEGENAMKNLKPILMILTVLALMPKWAFAGSVKVIANSSVSVNSISSGDLQAVFLLDSDSLGGSHVVPVLEKSGPAHEAFLKEYLGKSDESLLAFYRSLVFTGKAEMPKFLGSDAAVVAYVANTKGAVGYVSADTPTSGTKTLEVR